MQKSIRSALVSTKWLRELLKEKSGNHRILDGAWHLPNSGRIAAEEYKIQHIPGALYFNVDECANTSTDLPHMIPSAEQFESYVGNLGINNDTHVIVYDNNPQFPLFSAQRVWWTFRLFGHEKVSLLEGGLQKWIEEKGPLSDKVPTVPEEKFNAKFHPHLVKNYEDIVNNIKDAAFQLVDARPDGRFKGTAPEPLEGMKPGNIVGSSNLPYATLLDVDKKCLKRPDELKKIFADHEVDLEKPLVITCGSGMTACIIALAAYECGNDKVAVYDGSWTEFYQKAPENLKRNVPTD